MDKNSGENILVGQLSLNFFLRLLVLLFALLLRRKGHWQQSAFGLVEILYLAKAADSALPRRKRACERA